MGVTISPLPSIGGKMILPVRWLVAGLFGLAGPNAADHEITALVGVGEHREVETFNWRCHVDGDAGVAAFCGVGVDLAAKSGAG